MTSSRISGLHRLDIGERIDELQGRGWLAEADAVALRHGRCVLSPSAADKIIENVIATFGLPFAIAPNFVVNGRAYVVPLVVEEPSVVAALSNAARLALNSGGFEVECEESLLAGQVHLANIADVEEAKLKIVAAKNELLDSANAVHPNLVARGGGARDLELHELDLPNGEQTLVVHLLVDTCDAMGANLVNTMCEAVAPALAKLSGGTVAMSILSNLADRSLVTAGAHAYAARDGQYRSLTRWYVHESGDLCGEICLPLKVGIVGGTLAANPAAAVALRITGVDSAVELAGLMAAVGLAQNFAAIRALVTTGIQAGHMRLHARSAAKKIDVDDVDSTASSAAAKVILLGEHAVVYGRHAVALPIPEAVSARVSRDKPQPSFPEVFADGIALIARELDVDMAGIDIQIRSRVPRGMGLGSSAAIAVAIIRGMNSEFDLGLADERVNAIAFECEKLAHGTPSGLDNTVATYAKAMLFRRTTELEISPISLSEQAPLLIAFSNSTGKTIEQLAGVRARREKNKTHYDAIFDEIDALSRAGAEALAAADYVQLGLLMNICHGLLNAIEVSTPELEGMISIARASGAAGAKMTGAGGGGAVVAVCPETLDAVEAAFSSAGFGTMRLSDE